MDSSPHSLTPPPPPFHPISPPTPDDCPTVVIVVFISFGCVFFLALCLFALWCLIKKRKRTKMVHETEIIRADEHRRIKEAIVQGPHGPKVVILSVEDDKHIEEEIIKNERKLEGKNIHAKSEDVTTTSDLEAGESSSNPTLK